MNSPVLRRASQPARASKPKIDGRLGVADWVDAAVACMLRSSVEGVRINELARDLKATKGSFYWHFRDRAALLRAVLQRWEQITLELNELLDSELDAERRLLRLLRLPEDVPPAQIPHGDFETAIRNWARRSAEVRLVVKRVDRLREQNHVRIFEDLGCGGERALALARIAGAVAGRLWVARPWSAGERQQVINETFAMLMRAVAAEQAGSAGADG